MPLHEGDFRNIASSINVYGQGLGNFGPAVAIVEECWAAHRRSDGRGSYSYDWKSVMKI
jgi:hypothetical protein